MAWKFKSPKRESNPAESRVVLVPISLDELQEMIAETVKAVLRDHTGTDKEGDQILDSAQVCKEFGISIPTLIKYRKQGLIPFFNIGNRVRFKRRLVYEALGRISQIWKHRES